MISSIILIASVWFGVAIAKKIPRKKIYNQFLLTFSGSFLLGVAILEIFPTLYKSNHSYNISLVILFGILFQILLELVTKGIEHGHVHIKEKRNFYVIFLGLLIHSFLEGMPIKDTENINQISHHLLSAIVVHNIPVSIIFYYLLDTIFEKSRIKFLYVLLFSIAAPFGSLIGNVWLFSYNDLILAFISGTFLHISTLILFESSKNHQYNINIFIAIILGVGIAIVNTL